MGNNKQTHINNALSLYREYVCGLIKVSESGTRSCTRQNTFTYSTKCNLLPSATMMAIGCDPRCARFSGMKKPLRCDAVTESALHLKWLCVCIATNKFRSHKHKNTLVTRTRTYAHITMRVRLHNGPVLHGAFGGLSLRAALSVCVCDARERGSDSSTLLLVFFSTKFAT